MGSDQRELGSRAIRIPPLQGGERTTPSGAGAAQRREDHDGPRDGDRRLRHEVLRATAEALSAKSRHGEAVREQSRPRGSDREAEFVLTGRVLDYGCARARPRLWTDVRIRPDQG